MEPRYPRYMSDAQRIEHALELLDEAYSCLCYVGICAAEPCTAEPCTAGAARPAKVQKALDRLDKAMASLEKHRDGAL